jgi:hypothetical protein
MNESGKWLVARGKLKVFQVVSKSVELPVRCSNNEARNRGTEILTN